jgi:hypothetical protein
VRGDADSVPVVGHQVISVRPGGSRLVSAREAVDLAGCSLRVPHCPLRFETEQRIFALWFVGLIAGLSVVVVGATGVDPTFKFDYTNEG